MKWWPDVCCPGDMIRVSIGSVKHYGVFISEQEIIQFGPPPVALTAVDDSKICVCVTTAKEFSCGNIIERAILDKKESRLRLKPQETIRIARSRIGEKGYSLLHNNCEHFAYECVFGIKKSTQEEEARDRWRNRPVIDLYVAQLPQQRNDCHFPCKNRKYSMRDFVAKMKDKPSFEREIFLYAANRTYGLQENDIKFIKTIFGGWKCEQFYFSVSRTDEVILVGISNKPLKVDVIAAVDQKDKQNRNKNKVFVRNETREAKDFEVQRFPNMLFEVCGEQVNNVRFFCYEEGSARTVDMKMIDSGKNE